MFDSSHNPRTCTNQLAVINFHNVANRYITELFGAIFFCVNRSIVLEHRSIADLEAYSNMYMLTGHESTVWWWPDLISCFNFVEYCCERELHMTWPTKWVVGFFYELSVYFVVRFIFQSMRDFYIVDRINNEWINTTDVNFFTFFV